MSRRTQELPLRRITGGALLFAALCGPAHLRGQEPDPLLPSAAAVQGYLEISPRIARLYGQSSALAGVAAILGFSGRWRAGGAGFFLLERIDLRLPPPLETRQLHMGYAGLLVERTLWSNDSPALRSPGDLGFITRLLLGAGNAEVRDSATGSRLRSDNFIVVEPTLLIQLPLADWVSAGAAAGYRIAMGVDGLQHVEEEELRGLSVGFLLRLGPF